MSSEKRVTKKSSSNGKITTYLGKRDHIDHITHTDPVEGVVLISPDYIAQKTKVFVKLLCAFRYGSEDLDVLGLQFRRDFCSEVVQVFPPLGGSKLKPQCLLQEQLLEKLGEHAYPFVVEIPNDAPCSISLQPVPGSEHKPCGVDYQLRTYVGEQTEDQTSLVRLTIRKVQFAPDTTGPQPRAETQKEFLMSGKPLCLEASLDKELSYHGEDINVNVLVNNNSSKTVKRIKITVQQLADICLFSTAQFNGSVAEAEFNDEVAPNSTMSKVYQVCPLLKDNKKKYGLAVDGQLKQKDTNLASSTIMKDGVSKENHGIIVQYKVKVQLSVGGLGGDVCLELPLSLMHRKPQ